MKNRFAARLQHDRGFTIVELLVVIVVIAILAAITIVAYSGIQARAQNDQTVSAVAEYAKILENYATTNTVYPSTTYVCLGPIGTVCANETDGTVTASCNYAGSMAANSTFDAAVKTQVPNPPTPSTQTMTCGGKVFGGAWYNTNDGGKTASITYYLNGANASCVTPTGMNFNFVYRQDSTTACYENFPAA